MFRTNAAIVSNNRSVVRGLKKTVINRPFRVGVVPVIMSRRIALLLAAALASAFASTWAIEPGGLTVSSYEWLDPAPRPGTEAQVKVTLRGVVPLEDVAIRVEMPPLAAARFSAEVDPGARGRVDIGSLPANRPIVFHLFVTVPSDGGGVAAFRVSGRDPSGRPFEEGFGLPVGTVGQKPRLRDGALEFDAEPPPASSPPSQGG